MGLLMLVGFAGLGLRARAQDSIFPLSKNFQIDAWRLDDVLRDGTTTAIAQTPDGYLWIGSFQGVFRYDGKRFAKFTPENTRELPSASVICLFLDQAGALWLGTWAGPVRIFKGVWEDLHTRPGWKGQPVRSMAQNSQGDVYLSTDTGLFRYQAGRFEEIELPTTQRHASIAFDGQDQLWLGTEDTLSVRQDGRWRTVYSIPGPDRKMSRISRSRDGGIWVPDSEEIRCWRAGQWAKSYKLPSRFRHDTASVWEARQGCLWAALFSRGLLAFFPDGGVGYAATGEGLLNDATRDVFEDGEGNIWAASNGGGLARLKSRRLLVLGREDGLQQGVVNSAVEEAPGQLLVATHGGGLVPYDGRRFGEPWSTPGCLAHGNWILCGLKRASGALWFGVYMHGLVHFESGGAGTVLAAATPIPDVNCLFEDRRKRLWIGTTNGLARLDDNSGSLQPQLPTGRISAIAEDAASRLWVIASGQLVCAADTAGETASFAAFSFKHPYHPVSLYDDQSGSLWVGFDSGRLGRIQGDRVVIYGPEHGLPGANFSSVIGDAQGDLWAGTDIGILRLSRAALDAVQSGRTQSLTCVKYDRSDGLLAKQCREGYQPMSGRLSDGRLWFSTLQGLAMVDPRRATYHPTPTPWIEEIGIDSRRTPVIPGATREMVIPAGTRRAEVTFTGISLEAAERVGFQYQLRPSDTDWLPVGLDRAVQFRDPRPGRYTFRVRAAADCANWSAPAELALVVQPFFWQTIGFKLMAGTALLAVAALVAAQRVKQRYQRALAAQQQKFAREKAAQLESSNQVLRKRQQELEDAMARVKSLSGLIPICASCHNIRDDKGYWERVEVYVQNHSEATFSHGLCPNCIRKLYPGIAKEMGLTDTNQSTP